MDKDLLKRLALLKTKPELANILPQEQLISMMADFVKAFQSLQKAVETNKLKGDKGDDGRTPVAGKDYPTYQEIDNVLTTSLQSYATEYAKFQEKVNQVITRAESLENGKDAEITEELKQEIAEIAFSLIELPDFDTLVSTEITRNSEAIRDALELLTGDARYRVEIADVKGLQAMLDQLALIRSQGGTIGKGQVYNFIRQAVADGTIPAGGSGAVDSVNGQTGVVVLDADDIDDTSTTNKFTTTAEKALVASAVQPGDLGAVATSNDYNDLDNLPDLSVFDEVEQYANLAAFPGTGNSAKFYLAQDTGIIYRWTGSAYAEISAQLALGETSSTAYRGDRGKIAYDHSQLTTGNPHNVTKGDVGLGSVPNLDTTTAVAQTHTHSNKATLDAITEAFTTALKSAYDTASSWVTTNGASVLSHLSNTSNPHSVTKTQVGLGSVDNVSAASLRDRSTHTGTQTASTISDFNSSTRAQVEAELVAGTNITITPSGSGATRQLTIAASGGGGGGSGDVVGPSSATDNAIPRYDGTTGKLIQNSSSTITDAGEMVVNGTTPAVENGTNSAITVDNTSSGDGFVTFRNTLAGFAQSMRVRANSLYCHFDIITTGSAWLVGNFGSSSFGIYDSDNGIEVIKIAMGNVATVIDIASTGVTIFGYDVVVPDEAYGPGWNGSLEVPTKNAVYDKIESLGGGGGGGITRGQVLANVNSIILV